MFELRITLGNAAMLTPQDVADALGRVARQLRDREPEDVWVGGNIRDFNGNRVGEWTLTPWSANPK